MIKGERQIAQNYIAVLDKIPFNKKWVSYYKNLLEDGSILGEDKQLKNLIQSKLDTNVVIVHNMYINQPDYILRLLLKSNKNNKMAFEYMLSYYLLKADLEQFIHYIHFMENFDYYNIPNHYEEAIVLYMVLSGAQPAGIQISSINPTVFKKFNNYQNIFIENNRNKRLAQKELFKNYGDTYWYYCMYNSKNPIQINMK